MAYTYPTPAALARRLIESVPPGATPRDNAAEALEACERLYRELRYWVGADGGQVLFRRAIARARVQHPSLQTIQLSSRSETLLGGVQESVQSHGAAATVAGIEAVLAAILELLARLIGDDMTLKFAEDSLADRARIVASRPQKKRAQ